jgi:hypothetical protein
MSDPCEVLTFVNVYPLTKAIVLTSNSNYVGHSILKFFPLIIIIDYGFWSRNKLKTNSNQDIINKK